MDNTTVMQLTLSPDLIVRSFSNFHIFTPHPSSERPDRTRAGLNSDPFLSGEGHLFFFFFVFFNLYLGISSLCVHNETQYPLSHSLLNPFSWIYLPHVQVAAETTGPDREAENDCAGADRGERN